MGREYVVNSFELSRELSGHPSLSFELLVPMSEYASQVANFAPGRRLSVGGIGFAVSSLDVTQGVFSATMGMSLIRVSCVGRWSQCLTPAAYADIRYPGISVARIDAIAARSGCVLDIPTISVVVPRDLPGSSAYDWASTMDGHALARRSVPFWSDSGKVYFKPIGFDMPVTWILTENDLVGGISINYATPYLWSSNRPTSSLIAPRPLSQITDINLIAPLPGEPVLAPRPRPTYLHTGSLLTGEYGATEAEFTNYQWLNALGAGTSFIPRSRTILTSTSGSNALPSWASGKVKNLSASHDATGYTQTKTISQTQDGLPLFDDQEIWGFAIPADGLNTPAANYWQVVEKRTTTYSYGKYGYLLGSTTQGYKLLRFETPSSKKKAVDLNKPENIKKYSFSTVPLSGGRSITLKSIANAYGDQSEPIGTYTDVNGATQYDPTYVPSFFAQKEQTLEIAYESASNPKEGLPDLIKGKESRTEKEIAVKPSQVQYYSGGLSSAQIKGLKRQDERYTEYANEYQSEGSGFDGVAQSTSTTEYQGRPSEAARLPALFQNAADLGEGNSPVLFSNLFSGLLIKSEGYDGVNTGSTSYPQAETINQVYASAETDYLLKNIQQASTINFSLMGPTAITEGDRLKLTVQGLIYDGIVSSVRISGTVQATEKLQITSEIVLALLPEYRATQYTFLQNSQFSGLGANEEIEGLSLNVIVSNRLSG
jgi:hypothetical protein